MEICNNHEEEIAYDDSRGKGCPACGNIEALNEEVAELEKKVEDLQEQLAELKSE